MDILFGLLIFLSVAVSSTYVWAARKERRRRIMELLTSERAVPAGKKPSFHRGYLARLEALAKQAGYNLSGMEIAGIGILCVAALFGTGLVLFSGYPSALLISLPGFFLPQKFLKFQIRNRASKMLDQLAKLLPTVANYLRTGYSLQQAIITGAAKTPEPFREVFARVKKDIDTGIPVVKALENAAEGVPLTEFQLVVLATKINNQIGGNLADIYENISQTISERQEMAGQQKAYTAQAQLNSNIVGLMAVALVVIFRFISPDYFNPLLETWPGRLVFAGCWTSIILGWFVARKLAQPRL